MMYYRSTRAFTLIELLVVIAIIGILASVVLGALNSARAKGRDGSIVANVNSLSSQAAIYDDTNGTYGDTAGVSNCGIGLFSDTTFQNVFTSYDTTIFPGGTKGCYANGGSYAVVFERATGNGYTPPTVYWCADNSGRKCGIDDISGIPAATSCGCP